MICERALRSWPACPTLVITPDDCEAPFREMVGPYIPITSQGDGDLGQRLIRASSVALGEGAAKVLIIGCDSPTMPASAITQATQVLDTGDIAVGPSEDGGFYLIGLTRFQDDMFDSVDWGTDRVVRQTIDSLATCGMKVTLLPKWYDIDRHEDLRRAVRDIRRAHQRDDFELLRVLEGVVDVQSSGRVKAKK